METSVLERITGTVGGVKEVHPGLSRFPPHLADFGLVDSSCSIVVSKAMAINFAYIPGFFAQDAPNADPDAIGAVSEMRRAGRAKD